MDLARKIAGVALIAFPFLAIAAFGVSEIGFSKTILAFAITGIIALSVSAGLKLMAD